MGPFLLTQSYPIHGWTEANLGMFSMFCRTGAPQKGGPHRPDIVGRQRDIFWPVGWGLFIPYCDI